MNDHSYVGLELIKFLKKDVLWLKYNSILDHIHNQGSLTFDLLVALPTLD